MSVSLCVCPSVTRLHRAKAAERIEVLFGAEVLGNPRKLRTGSPIFPRIRRGLRQITLTSCVFSHSKAWITLLKSILTYKLHQTLALAL